jgi:hypothetical protein
MTWLLVYQSLCRSSTSTDHSVLAGWQDSLVESSCQFAVFSASTSTKIWGRIEAGFMHVLMARKLHSQHQHAFVLHGKATMLCIAAMGMVPSASFHVPATQLSTSSDLV